MRNSTQAMATPITTEQIIHDLLVQAGVTVTGQNHRDYRLLDDNELDSFSKISLYMEIESEFAITLAPHELLDERYRSIAGLASLVDRKIQRSHGS